MLKKKFKIEQIDEAPDYLDGSDHELNVESELLNEISDSEEEHISEASEDDDDELSCETVIRPLVRRLKLKSFPRVSAHKNRNRNVIVKQVKRKRPNPKSKKPNLNRSVFFISKDETKWNKEPFPGNNRDVQINDNFDKVNIPDNISTFNNIFKLFFTDEICGSIVKYTNMEAMKFYSSIDDWKLVTIQELHAFFGLLITAGHMKSCNENYRTFWHPFYGSTFFKATKSVSRFEQLLRFIRFDDKSTRSERRKTDKLCPIRDIWERVTANFKKYYSPFQNLTVDEQLMPCRSRCSFIQFMPKKPDKYGIKIFWVCDSKNAYPLQGFVYTGKNGDKR